MRCAHGINYTHIIYTYTRGEKTCYIGPWCITGTLIVWQVIQEGYAQVTSIILCGKVNVFITNLEKSFRKQIPVLILKNIYEKQIEHSQGSTAPVTKDTMLNLFSESVQVQL